MLVVRIELWPRGDASSRKTLATGTIANDGTGTITQGNYQVVLKDAIGRSWKTGTVKGFPRKRRLGWDLLACALYSMLGKRNGLSDCVNREGERQLSRSSS